jgi:hypothetical protein
LEYAIDDLYNKTFSLPNIYYKEDYYYQSKESCKSISKNITPNCTERQIGKVFFSTVTRYTEREGLVLQDKPQHLKHYIVRDQRKIFIKNFKKDTTDCWYFVCGSGILRHNLIEDYTLNVDIYKYTGINDPFCSRKEYQRIEDKVFDLLKKAITIDNTRAETEEFYNIHQHLSLYKIWSDKLEEEIKEVTLEKIKNKIFVRKISRVYKPCYNKR